ncbi:hypothetical protein GGR52DRAFT_346267 [Hypoxylon sp. FL1284]|nr:hypothetical protein GGR52DRAFT_346267 [Hypoxylon sp. FL1284]
MDSGRSIISDKVIQSVGPVHRSSHRSSDASGPSSPRAAELATTEHSDGSPAELPASPVRVASGQSHHGAAAVLPPYSGPSDASLDRSPPLKGPQHYPGLPVLDYRLYAPPGFELSADATTVAGRAAHLSENARALAALLRSLATVPPKPQVLIQGTRGRGRVDFALRLNLMNLLVPADPRDRLDYLRCVGRDEVALRGGGEPGLKPDFGVDGGLEAWCDRFVRDPASVKSFALERVVANLDTNWIEGQVRSLVAATEYKGQVAVQFPVAHARVVVQNPERHGRFLASVTTLFASKSRYEVIKAVWPFATARSGEPARRCLVQSERTWWEEWRDPIKYAMATKRQGWVTNEDKLECIMESKGKGISMIDWGPESDPGTHNNWA